MKNLFEKLYNKSANSFYNLLKLNLKKEKKMFIVTANPETFMMSENDEELNKLLNNKETVLVPDGIGIVKASRMIGYDVKERIAGIDIANELLKYGNELEKTIYLFGSKQEVIDSMLDVLKKNYPKLKVVGSSNGYEKDKDKVFKKIISKKPDIVLVALGIPKQEKLIYKYLDKFDKGIFVGVGGSFDVISGYKKRAPKIFIKLNLEWLYRIVKEPKRLKRFYDSNVKFMFKVKKSDSKKNINILFILLVFIYFSSGLFLTLLGLNDINYYENRTAYKIENPTIDKILDKTYQDNVELAFSDQILFSSHIKKGYNLYGNLLSNKLSKAVLSNECNDRYINLGNSIITFGCDDNIVYRESYVSQNKDNFDKRIDNVNEVISKSSVPVYIYYIEKDTDINFSTNNKSDVYDYLKENIQTEKIYKFEINNFGEFKNYFYKTDHHWNHKGSYVAYEQLVSILVKDEPIEYKTEICLNKNFSGSKANYGGASLLYKEDFCTYVFDFPDYDILVNGDSSSYGNYKYYIENPDEQISYGSFYGGDSGEIIFDNYESSKENILIIGESYDNAILNLLAVHFNKTHSIDLRNYERENNKKFNYIEYLKENDINKVLLIGNMDYFSLEEFNLEV